MAYELSYDQLIHLNQKDVVVATSFYRYATENSEMVKFCRDHGVCVIAITDDSSSPIAAADIKIFLPAAYGTIFDSYCSVYCFFNMMVTQVCWMNKPEAAELFEKHELVAKRFDVYAEVSRRKFGQSRLSEAPVASSLVKIPIAARMIAAGKITKKGALSAAIDIPYECFMRQLAHRGIRIDENIIDVTD